jgi:hypothetical protein
MWTAVSSARISFTFACFTRSDNVLSIPTSWSRERNVCHAARTMRMCTRATRSAGPRRSLISPTQDVGAADSRTAEHLVLTSHHRTGYYVGVYV